MFFLFTLVFIIKCDINSSDSQDSDLAKIKRSKEVRDSLSGEIICLSNSNQLKIVEAKYGDSEIGLRSVANSSFGIGPKWSPDGSKIACVGANLSGQYRYLTIVNRKINLNNSFILDSDINIQTITWSSDGLYITILTKDNSSDNNRIYYVNILTREIISTQLTTGTPSEYYTSIAWRPKGNKIAISLRHGNIFTGDQRNSIWIFNAFDDNPQENPDNLILDVPPQVIEVDYMDWSPDGSMLAYSEGGYNKIYIVNYDGSDNREIILKGIYSDETILGLAPAWASNNKQIIFTGVTEYTGENYSIIPGLFVTDIYGSYKVNIKIAGRLPDWY